MKDNKFILTDFIFIIPLLEKNSKKIQKNLVSKFRTELCHWISTLKIYFYKRKSQNRPRFIFCASNSEEFTPINAFKKICQHAEDPHMVRVFFRAVFLFPYGKYNFRIKFSSFFSQSFSSRIGKIFLARARKLYTIRE